MLCPLSLVPRVDRWGLWPPGSVSEDGSGWTLSWGWGAPREEEGDLFGEGYYWAWGQDQGIITAQ